MTVTVTRFAPSPTGFLHLGHAFAALVAHDAARTESGQFLLRIEDIDQDRARAGFVDAIFEDLTWLDLSWDTPVRHQSHCFDAYVNALAKLDAAGVIYPCFCTRREIQTEIAAAAGAPHGPTGAHYPGTCRRLTRSERTERSARGQAYALRLDVETAIAKVGGSLSFIEEGFGPNGETGLVIAAPERLGDVVLARKDAPGSYHLCVTVDDAEQGVTLVTRGEDLFEATFIHRLLQALLGLPTPRYRHHRLIRHTDGQRLAKRDAAMTLRELRKSRHTPADIRRMVGL